MVSEIYLAQCEHILPVEIKFGTLNQRVALTRRRLQEASKEFDVAEKSLPINRVLWKIFRWRSPLHDSFAY